ncbi:MAG: hypothetical protein MHMPM18_002043 [Marteilia pararefringens]
MPQSDKISGMDKVLEAPKPKSNTRFLPQPHGMTIFLNSQPIDLNKCSNRVQRFVNLNHCIRIGQQMNNKLAIHIHSQNYIVISKPID